MQTIMQGIASEPLIIDYSVIPEFVLQMVEEEFRVTQNKIPRFIGSIRCEHSPGLNKWLKYMETYEGDRNPESEKGLQRRDYLFNRAGDCLLHDLEWAIVVYKGTTLLRLNGGSSCYMLQECIDAGMYDELFFKQWGDLSRKLKVTIHIGVADDPMGLGLLFSQFDATISMRNETDRTRAMKVAANITGANMKLQAMSAGVAHCRRMLGLSVETTMTREIYIKEYPEYYTLYYPFLAGKAFRLVGVQAGMFASYLDARRKGNIASSISFWDRVKCRDHEEPSDITRQLGDLIWEPDHSRKLSTREYANYYAMMSWNAWYAHIMGKYVNSLRRTRKIHDSFYDLSKELAP